MLEKIKRFDPLGGMQLEDAMVLSTFVRQLEAEYETLKVEKPDWLKEQTTRLRRFIEDMVRDARKKQISALRARLDALKTPTERRAELERMLAELESTEK